MQVYDRFGGSISPSICDPLLHFLKAKFWQKQIGLTSLVFSMCVEELFGMCVGGPEIF